MSLGNDKYVHLDEEERRKVVEQRVLKCFGGDGSQYGDKGQLHLGQGLAANEEHNQWLFAHVDLVGMESGRSELFKYYNKAPSGALRVDKLVLNSSGSVLGCCFPPGAFPWMATVQQLSLDMCTFEVLDNVQAIDRFPKLRKVSATNNNKLRVISLKFLQKLQESNVELFVMRSSPLVSPPLSMVNGNHKVNIGASIVWLEGAAAKEAAAAETVVGDVGGRPDAERAAVETEGCISVAGAIQSAGKAAAFAKYAEMALEDGLDSLSVLINYHSQDPTLQNLMQDLEITKRPHKIAVSERLIALLQNQQPTPVDTPVNGELNEAMVRAESWYPRYLQSVTDAYATARKKYPGARIKVAGVIPDNHTVYGARTRLEFICLEQDILQALRAGTLTDIEEPEMTRVRFQHLRADIDDANANEESMHLLIASCPSRIGDDETVMQKVTEMAGCGPGHRACTIRFSKQGNVASTLGY